MYSLGIDLGGTFIKAVIITPDGTIVAEHMNPTPAQGGLTPVCHAIIKTVTELCIANDIPLSSLDHGGLGVPGLVESSKGPVFLAPNISWHNVNPIPVLEEALGIPMYVGNDADCCALSENAFGAGREYSSFLMLTLGTGVGGAIVYDDKLFTGLTPFGGELGHVPLIYGGRHCNCGMDGCLEQYASGTALMRMIREQYPEEILPAELFTRAEAGDELCEKILDEYTGYLATGIAGFINVWRPSAIILAGGIANAGEPLLRRVREKLKSLSYCSELIAPPPILKAEIGNHSGALGAALLHE